MTWSPSAWRGALAALAVVVVAATAVGIGVRATYGAHTTADEPQYLLSALSLAEDGDLDISDELAAARYRPFHAADLPQQTEPRPDGSRISPHDPLLPLLLAVPMGVFGWVGAKGFLALVAGALAVLTAWTAHRRFGVSEPVAILVAGLFSLAPPLAVYATQVYPEVVAALAVTAAVAALVGPSPQRMVALLVVVALPWLAVKYVPVAAVLAVWLLARCEPIRRRGYLLALAAAGVAYVGVHLGVYGGVTAYAAGDHFVGGEFTAVGARVDLWGRSTRLVGLLVDRGFGLAAWQPAFLLAPIAAAWALGRRLRVGWPLAVVAAGWITASFVALTMHGWWFPGRQVVVVVPLLAILVAVWADRSSLRLLSTGVLGAAGVGAFGVLLAAGLAGELTLVVDFVSTSDPLRTLAALLLPDYLADGAGTWIRHAAWVTLAVVAPVLGWRRGRAESRAEPDRQSGPPSQRRAPETDERLIEEMA